MRHDSFAPNRNTCKLTSSVAISCISMGMMASSMTTLVRRRFVWTTISAVVCWKRATAAREAKPRLRLEKSMMMFCLMCTLFDFSGGEKIMRDQCMLISAIIHMNSMIINHTRKTVCCALLSLSMDHDFMSQ